MIIRPRIHLLLPLLALSASLAMAVSVHAQDRQHQGSDRTSATLQINLRTTPHWTAIRGTRVEELPAAERPDYDMFRYGGTYYVYHNDRWYTSPRERGDFTVIDERSVPSEFSGIPREHWRNYPSQWQDRPYQGSGGGSATLQINFGTTPRWMGIRGTRVRMIRQGQRPDYDMFQYGGSYYVYNNNRWYMSRRSRGQFAMIDERLVPRELSRVPREHWRTYPTQWSDQNSNPRYGRQGERH
jgi:hypothetical protein